MSIRKTSIRIFYNNFHKKNSRTHKIIDPKSFTYQNILKIINDTLPNKNIKILDYGCGTGSVALYLSNGINKVTGYDISNKAISLCKYSANKNNLKNIFFTDDLKQVGDKFDIVICIEVVEHVKNDVELINLLNNKLSKNGKLILSTPSLNAPLYRLGLLENFDKSVGHLRRYDNNSLISIFSKTNLKIDKIVQNESILRNSLFTITKLGFLIRFIRFPFSSIINWIDNKLISICGESDLIVIASKK